MEWAIRLWTATRIVCNPETEAVSGNMVVQLAHGHDVPITGSLRDHSNREVKMQALLIPISGGKPLRLEKEVTVVGRRRWVCDIHFDDPTISKFHCLLMQSRDNIFYVRDLGSANGTLVNGHKVTEEAIIHGDEVAFANLRYTFHVAASETGSASGEFVPPPRSAPADTSNDRTIPEVPSSFRPRAADDSKTISAEGIEPRVRDAAELDVTYLSSESDVRRLSDER